jgi:hypothetical protein
MLSFFQYFYDAIKKKLDRNSVKIMNLRFETLLRFRSKKVEKNSRCRTIL